MHELLHIRFDSPIMSHFRNITFAILLALGSLALPTAAHACPGCAEAQAGQGPGRVNIVRGYQLSIIFMMAMPFLIVGSFGGYVYYTMYHGRGETDAAPPSTDAEETTPSASNDE
ncbi:MAG: hypothetical protein C0483_16945 [Pirellula sp.]|nr:hypothetical protein [Pirellula sp.]